MMPKVDTFEVDIAGEIKRKEASLAEISAASNNVGNNDDVTLPKNPPIFLIALVTFFILCVCGFGALAYFYFNDPLLSPPTQPVVINPNSAPKTTTEIQKLSPALAGGIGRFVTRVEKKEKGYVITISEYSPVFAYMTRHENEYIEELSTLLGAVTQSSTTPTQALSDTKATPPQATTTATTTQTSTQAKATTTVTSLKKTQVGTSTQVIQTTTTTPPIIPVEQHSSEGQHFTDVTIANQNMRVWTSGNHVVVYAFLGNNTILISNTTDGILSLKGAILH